jgi:hypothetical protein
VALLLRAKGITRVRPLEDGSDAWLADNFPFRKPRQETRYFLKEGIFRSHWCRQKSAMSKSSLLIPSDRMNCSQLSDN